MAVLTDITLLTDIQLLEEFRNSRSPETFAEIVRRHGAMVFGLCRRLVGNAHDAEDASQAAFLVLSKRPSAVQGTLAAWLHEVARRTSSEVIRARTRRQKREETAAQMKTTATVDAEEDLREELDAALANLPSRLREAVVLRYLEGRGQEEAAQLVGCPQGTLAWRCMEGLNRLRSILSRRGVMVSAGVLVGFMSQEVSANAQSALSATAPFTGGTSFVPSDRVAEIADGALRSMTWQTVKFYAAVSAALLAIGAVLLTQLVNWSGPITEAATLKGHTQAVVCLAFAPGGHSLVSASRDQTLKVWDVPGGKERLTLSGHAAAFRYVAISRHGKLIGAEYDDETVQLWKFDNGEPVRKQERSLLRASSPFSRGGMALSARLRPLAQAGQPIFTASWTGESQPKPIRMKAAVTALVFSPDSETLAVAEVGGVIRLLDAETGSERMVLAERGHWLVIAFADDGTTLAGVNQEGDVKLWDARNGQERSAFQMPTDGMTSCAFSPDCLRLAVGYASDAITLWEVPTGRSVANLRGRSGAVLCLTFAPDGKTLATGSADGRIKLWSMVEEK